MDKYRERNLPRRLLPDQSSAFSRHLSATPKVRRRVILLLLYFLEIFGNQITANSSLEGEVGSIVVDASCSVNRKEALSAIQRAKTNFCKEEITAIACKNNNNSLYPQRLPRFCENKVTAFGRHLGCFKDDEKSRLLGDFFKLLKHRNSPSNCVDECLQYGFQYAGVQYGVECFCGNKKPSEDELIHPSQCNMNCPAFVSLLENGIPLQNRDNVFDGAADNQDFKATCGGYFTMNVYETGVLHGTISQGHGISFEEIQNSGTSAEPVRIVFLLTLNGRSYRQVVRLIKALFHERHFFYIHVDARQDYLYRELLILSRKLPKHVKFVTNRRATIWGGASLLSVLLSAMQNLVTYTDEWNWHWDYVINLSESDFPLKTIGQLETFLSHNKGKNFVKSQGKDVQKFIQKQGLDKTFYECENRMWRIGDRVLPKGIVIDGGSDWIALNYEYVRYIIHSNDSLVEGLKSLFQYTLLPAESFFHTVLRNSVFCDTFVDNNLHVTNWKRKLGCKCQYRNVVDWCGCSPNDFRLNDWQRLQLTENRLLFFGRKFESVVSQGIVNKLESWLYPNRSLVHSNTWDRFWQSIYHRYDLSPKVDDAVMTLGYSLSRHAMNFIDKRFPSLVSCGSSESELLDGVVAAEFAYECMDDLELVDMTLFLQHDQIQGLLVRFHSQYFQHNHHADVEAWFAFKTLTVENLSASPLTDLQGRIQEVQVGLDYDQKEQIFRHFSRAMGPESEPTLAYNCITNESFNATFVWVNPDQSVQSVINISISDGSTSNFIKPNLQTPLMPGQWRVEILGQDGVELLRTHFLILPLQFRNGKIVNRFANLQSPSSHHHPSGGNEPVKPSLEMLQWIDSLTLMHYELQDLCKENELPKNSQINKDEAGAIPACVDKGWSSMFPDTKSTIEGIDKTTGFLVP